MPRNVRTIRKIRRGQKITAQYLNAIGTAVNSNTEALGGPKQKRDPEVSDGGGGGSSPLNLNFTETGRTNTTVEITDSNGDTHDIEQIDQVTLQNPTGDILTLTFTNP